MARAALHEVKAGRRGAPYDVRMRLSNFAVRLLPLFLLAACAGTPRTQASEGATFIVVRHAEKVDASRDPDLSAAGHARAHALAQALAGQAIDAAYVTNYKRTGQTLAPTLQARGLTPVAYAANEDPQAVAARLRATHPRGTVLVAGHSDTVPGIVAGLCGCEVAPMPDHEYDRLSTVRIDAVGRAHLQVSHYGAASVAP